MSNAAATPSSSGTMKLMVEKASQRFLFAEAGKDVVDFLFGVLAMPVGGVACLLRAEDKDAAAHAFGSVVNVYASAEKMDAAYMQGTDARDALVFNDILPVPGPQPAAYTYDPYNSYSSLHFSYCPPTPTAPRRGRPLRAAPAPQQQPADCTVDLKPPHDAAGLGGLLPPSLYRCHVCRAVGSTTWSEGFVQGAATYTVMDDLTVTPASNMSTVSLLGRFGVKDLGEVEEKTVAIGRKECLEILKVSLRPKTVLTDVFLAKTKKRARTAIYVDLESE